MFSYSRLNCPPLGPHGAGFTNSMFMARGTSVIEFAMKPMVNRTYGWLAVMFDQDYWMCPQIATNYHLKYTVDDEQVAAAVRLLKHVIETKGLTDLLVNHDEL